jgi:hypothetical protein
LDPFLISTAAGIVVAFLLGQIHPVSLHLGKGLVLVISFLALFSIRGLVATMARPSGEAMSFTRGSYSELIDALPKPTRKMIEEADEIQILAGTLIEFVRREADMKALAAATARGARVQIIMLDPDAEILRAIATERSSRRLSSTEEILSRLQGECRFSISRLHDVLPPGTLSQSLRLSSAMPHQAFARYDDDYLLAPYVFGRGGRSPAMFFSRSSSNKSLCDGLRQGFEDQWESSMVHRVPGAEVSTEG